MSQILSDPINQEMSRLFAADVIWMAQRMGLNVERDLTEARMVDSRYTRILRSAAEIWLSALEDEAASINGE